MPTDLFDLTLSRSALLLTEATQLKDGGDIDAAIAKLRQAYKVAASENIDHGIQAHLRLPLYLQKAGRMEEAWAEFNRLAVEGYDGRVRPDRGLFLFDLSAIFDKMRLTLQREKHPELAVRFGVWSIICEMGEGVSAEMLALSRDWLEREIVKLLKKAKRTDLVPEIMRLCVEELKRKKLDLPALGERIDHLIADSHEL